MSECFFRLVFHDFFQLSPDLGRLRMVWYMYGNVWYISHRIHGAAIYGAPWIPATKTPVMLAYIPAPWILWVSPQNGSAMLNLREDSERNTTMLTGMGCIWNMTATTYHQQQQQRQQQRQQ